MKKLTVLLVGILLVFGLAGMANADWFGTYYIPDEDTYINELEPWTFDIYFPMIGDDWEDRVYLGFSDDDDVRYIHSTTFDRSVDTFNWAIVDPLSGIGATLDLSGLLNLKELIPGAVSGSLTPIPGYIDDLNFEFVQLVFDPPPQGDAAPVPEPATMFLLGSGILGMFGFGRKKLLK